MNEFHPIEQLMKCTVRIEASLKSGGIATGSGFAFSFCQQTDGLYVPAIVTNKHVIDGAHTISMPISVADQNGEPTGRFEVVSYAIDERAVLYHPDPDTDLCAVLSSPIHNYFKEKNLTPVLIHLNHSIVANNTSFDELLPLEEVVMIGFPNGIWDSTNNGAIARRGAIATLPRDDYLGKKQFVVDMACFPGSSGSPVFLANFGSYASRDGALSVGSRIKLLGVLYAGPQYNASGEIILAPVPTQNRPITVTSIPNNLGYVIKATELDAIDDLAKKFLGVNPERV